MSMSAASRFVSRNILLHSRQPYFQYSIILMTHCIDYGESQAALLLIFHLEVIFFAV